MIDGLYDLLAKIGFSDPLHPPITHMPIGLVVGALIFFLIAIIFKRKNFELSARHACILAFVFAFPTILFGVFDWMHFYHATLMTPIIIKIILASIVIVTLGAGIILGGEIKLRNIWMTAIYAIAFVCVIGLGYFGASILYGRGMDEGKTGISKEAVAGKEIFAQNCMACHANGGNAVNSRYPLSKSKLLGDKSAFISFMRDPAKIIGATSEMPPFSKDVISDEDAGNLLEYIKSMVATAWK
jgi:uncharacterized membrane protein